MTRHEFYEWLDTCPTHKWEITYDDSEFISVSFPIEETIDCSKKSATLNNGEKP